MFTIDSVLVGDFLLCLFSLLLRLFVCLCCLLVDCLNILYGLWVLDVAVVF